MLTALLFLAACAAAAAADTAPQVQLAEPLSQVKAAFGRRLVRDRSSNDYKMRHYRFGPFRVVATLTLDPPSQRVAAFELDASGRQTCKHLERYALGYFGKPCDRDLISRHLYYAWNNSGRRGYVVFTAYLDDRDPRCWITYSFDRRECLRPLLPIMEHGAPCARLDYLPS